MSSCPRIDIIFFLFVMCKIASLQVHPAISTKEEMHLLACRYHPHPHPHCSGGLEVWRFGGLESRLRRSEMLVQIVQKITEHQCGQNYWIASFDLFSAIYWVMCKLLVYFLR